jgi:hypothetical protein
MELKNMLYVGILSLGVGCASVPCRHCENMGVPACNYLEPMVNQGGHNGDIDPAKVYNWWDTERKSEESTYRRRRAED